MALFGTKKKDTEAKPAKAKASKAVAPKAAVKAVAAAPAAVGSSAHVIVRPRITEKSGIMSQMGVYTFEVAVDANKNSIASAVKALYKVTPVKVTVINSPARNVFVRGKRGVVPGFRKASVTLKKGDKIDFL